MKTFFGKETPPLHEGIKSGVDVGVGGLFGCLGHLLLGLTQKLAKTGVYIGGESFGRCFPRMSLALLFNRGGSITFRHRPAPVDLVSTTCLAIAS